MISREEVKKLTELALLSVDEDEIDTLTGEIESILEYVSDIDTLAEGKDTKREKPELYNVMREDEVTNKEREYTKKILDEAPQTDGDYLRVKKIL
jgi:aspartyl-tRNA(Asn)/glutamyl-tRNA(Gln) amidotransferase subunit C